MAKRTNGPPKKLTAAVYQFVKGDGGLPAELLDGFICERFHVLPSQLENEDLSRLMPMIAALNTHSALRRVMEDYLESHGRVKPSENDWKIYIDAMKAAKETNA